MLTPARATTAPRTARRDDRVGPCPECRGLDCVQVVTPEDGGAISELVYPSLRPTHPVRRVRPATYYACNLCEWCSELRPTEWGPA